MYTVVSPESQTLRHTRDLWEVMGFILYTAKDEIKESLSIMRNVPIPKDEYTILLAVRILCLDINIFSHWVAYQTQAEQTQL